MRVRRARRPARRSAWTPERFLDARRDGVGFSRAPSPIRQSSPRSYHQRNRYWGTSPHRHEHSTDHRDCYGKKVYEREDQHRISLNTYRWDRECSRTDLFSHPVHEHDKRPPSPIPFSPKYDIFNGEASLYKPRDNFDNPEVDHRLNSSSLRREPRLNPNHNVVSSHIVANEPHITRISDLRLINTQPPTDSHCLVPYSKALASLQPDLHPAFWCLDNSEKWAKDSHISQQDNKRRREEERDDPKMADPFEVRMRFSSQLQHLNASQVSAQKAAQYAMKHRDMSEDLHSCILEQLEKTNMNTRANIMYFIDPFLELAEKERNGNDYIRRMQRDIIRVVDAVCPEDGSGAANVKVVRKVLRGLMSKGFLLEQTVDEIEECLKDRAAASHADMGFSSPINGEHANKASGAVARNTGADATGSNSLKSKPAKLEKRQIEHRIEEDRERHKKMRENMWVTPKDPAAKRRKFWDDQSDCGEDDDRLGEEDENECIELTGTGVDQDLRAKEYADNEAKKNGQGRVSQNGLKRDADGDVAMNGNQSR